MRSHHHRLILAALAAALIPRLALAQAVPGASASGAASPYLTNGLFDTIVSMVQNATANWVSLSAGIKRIGRI